MKLYSLMRRKRPSVIENSSDRAIVKEQRLWLAKSPPPAKEAHWPSYEEKKLLVMLERVSHVAFHNGCFCTTLLS